MGPFSLLVGRLARPGLDHNNSTAGRGGFCSNWLVADRQQDRTACRAAADGHRESSRAVMVNKTFYREISRGNNNDSLSHENEVSNHGPGFPGLLHFSLPALCQGKNSRWK